MNLFAQTLLTFWQKIQEPFVSQVLFGASKTGWRLTLCQVAAITQFFYSHIRSWRRLLVTGAGDSLSWWQVCDVGGRFEMLVTESLHWKSHQYKDSATNILNMSPTSLSSNYRQKFYIFSHISVRSKTNLITKMTFHPQSEMSQPFWLFETSFYLTEFTLFIILRSRFWIWFHFFSCHEPQTSKFKFFRLEIFQNFRNFKFLFMFEREWFYGELYQIVFNWLWA